MQSRWRHEDSNTQQHCVLLFRGEHLQQTLWDHLNSISPQTHKTKWSQTGQTWILSLLNSLKTPLDRHLLCPCKTKPLWNSTGSSHKPRIPTDRNNPSRRRDFSNSCRANRHEHRQARVSHVHPASATWLWARHFARERKNNIWANDERCHIVILVIAFGIGQLTEQELDKPRIWQVHRLHQLCALWLSWSSIGACRPAKTRAHIHPTVKSSLHVVNRNVDKYVISDDVLPSHDSDPDGHGRYRSVGLGNRIATSPATAAKQSERRWRDHFNAQDQNMGGHCARRLPLRLCKHNKAEKVLRQWSVCAVKISVHRALRCTALPVHPSLSRSLSLTLTLTYSHFFFFWHVWFYHEEACCDQRDEPRWVSLNEIASSTVRNGPWRSGRSRSFSTEHSYTKPLRKSSSEFTVKLRLFRIALDHVKDLLLLGSVLHDLLLFLLLPLPGFHRGSGL